MPGSVGVAREHPPDGERSRGLPDKTGHETHKRRGGVHGERETGQRERQPPLQPGGEKRLEQPGGGPLGRVERQRGAGRRGFRRKKKERTPAFSQKADLAIPAAAPKERFPGQPGLGPQHSFPPVHRVIEGVHPVALPIPFVVLQDLFARGPAMLRDVFPRAMVKLHRLRETGDGFLACLDRDADSAVRPDREGGAAAIQANHRKPLGHRFNDGKAAGIVKPREKKDVVGAIGGENVLPGLAALKSDPVVKFQRCNELFEILPRRAFAKERQGGIGFGKRQRFESQIDSFERNKAADEEETQRPLRRGQRFAGDQAPFDADGGKEMGRDAMSRESRFRFARGDEDRRGIPRPPA